MKSIATLVLLLTFSLGFSQEKAAPRAQIVEASCGQCQFGMKDKAGCDLAVKIDNKTYFVDGSKMNDHGDAHGANGMCTTVRKAKVLGEVVNNRFVATSFVLLPALLLG